MNFEIIGPIREKELIAKRPSLRIAKRLQDTWGSGRWRKLKVTATIRFYDRTLRRVELHLVRSTRHRQTRRSNKTILGPAMKQSKKQFALCIDNKDYEVSLILGKVYRVLRDPDPRTSKDGLIRVVDESGEDYLYHHSHFALVDFPADVKRQLLALRHTH